MGPGRGRKVSHGPVRPRYGRIASLVSAVGVTLVAMLGASGVLPGTDPSGRPADRVAVSLSAGRATGTPDRAPDDAPDGAPDGAAPERAAVLTSGAAAGMASPMMMAPGEQAAPTAPDPAPGPEVLPARSGSGKRVVFDIGDQRVWLVDDDGRVRRTYLVSGSLTDNLKPGTYEVYSTSRHAIGLDDAGTMQYMVRFTYGQRAAIGFHDIPVKNGRLLQTRAELGTPRSSGCIRQWRPDARALWDFAPVGTKVVVTA